MKHALILTLAAAAALVACKPQDKTENTPATAASATAAAPAAGGQGNWGARQKDYDAFVNSCVAGLPQDKQNESFKNYCHCMGDYVMNKYDDAFLRRLDASVARGEASEELKAMQEDLMTNGVKVCPLPTN